MTLKEVWESKGLTPTQVAAAAGISPSTLYKMNRKERVASFTVASVCRVLGISKQEYESLDADS